MIPNVEDGANRIKMLHTILEAILVELKEQLRQETKKDAE